MQVKKRILVLFLITFVIKLATCWYLSYLQKCYAPSLGNTELACYTGDASSYLEPIDNYIQHGEYSTIGQNGEKIYTGRAPYYGIPYYLFRQLFSQTLSYDLVVLLQIVFETIAILFLAKLTQHLLNNIKAFWLTYCLLLVGLDATHWANHLLTESLSISFLVIFFCHFYYFLTQKKIRYLFFASIFLCFVTLLKPYFGLLYLILGIQFLISLKKKFHLIAKYTFIMAIPLIILTLPYTIRNLKKFNRFMPFSDFFGGANYSKADLAYRGFLKAWGGSIVFWDKRSAACFFEPKDDLPCEFEFPDYAFCDGYSMVDIEQVKDLYVEYQKSPSLQLDDSVYHAFNKLTHAYKEYQPFRYYVLSKIISVKSFLFHSGSYYMPINKASPCYHPWQLVWKGIQSLMYYMTLLAGTIGLIVLAIKHPYSYIAATVPLLLILFFPIIYNASEFRYFAPSYPFLIVGLVIIISELVKKYTALINVVK